MIKLQPLSDKAAIGMSLLCACHCLVPQLLLVLTPSLTSLQLQNEALHLWLLFAVIPISIYALTLGCKQHKRFHLLAIGALGLTSLLLAVGLPASLLGERGEKSLTVIGAIIMAYGHYKNYTLCQHTHECVCHG